MSLAPPPHGSANLFTKKLGSKNLALLERAPVYNYNEQISALKSLTAQTRGSITTSTRPAVKKQFLLHHVTH